LNFVTIHAHSMGTGGPDYVPDSGAKSQPDRHSMLFQTVLSWSQLSEFNIALFGSADLIPEFIDKGYLGAG
jgi:hypothetical protein